MKITFSTISCLLGVFLNLTSQTGVEISSQVLTTNFSIQLQYMDDHLKKADLDKAGLVLHKPKNRKPNMGNQTGVEQGGPYMQ